jgi:hypothetical protein
LYFFDYDVENNPVTLETDASDYGIGGVLWQTVGGEKRCVAIYSKSLDATQFNWSTIEKEGYAIFYAFNKWEYMLRDIHFLIKTDHKNLTFVNRDNSQKVLRWKLAMQQFDFRVEHIAGKHNIVPDGLSRLCAVEPELVEQVNALQELWEIESDIGDYISEVNVLLRTLPGARSESLNASTSRPRAKRPMLRRRDIPADKFRLIASVHNLP